ncbi:MAG: O-antigen ligase family protein [Pseudomonadota bacterium]
MAARIAVYCLLLPVIIAPLLLGGARLWALAILILCLGIGVMVGSFTQQRIHAPILAKIWLAGLLLGGWMVVQSLPLFGPADFPKIDSTIALNPSALPAGLLMLLFCLLAFTLAQILRPDGNLIIRIVIASALIQAVLAGILAGFEVPTNLWFAKTAHIGDATGSFANRNAFGALMVIGILGCLHQWGRAVGPLMHRLDRQGGWIALAIVLSAALIATHSRASMISLATGLMAMIVFAPMARRKIIMSVIPLAVMLLILSDTTLTARFAELARPDFLQRDDLWRTALAAIAARPLAGYGMGGMDLVIDHFATPGLNMAARWPNSHNLFLDAALCFGLPVAFIGIAAILAFAVRILRAAAPSKDRALLAGFVTIILTHALFDSVIILPALILPILILAGSTVPVPPATREANRGDAEPDGQPVTAGR